MNGLKELFSAFYEYIEEEREYIGEFDEDNYFADKVKRLETIVINAEKDLEKIRDVLEFFEDEHFGFDGSNKA